MGIVGFSFSSGSLRSHSRNEAYYAKMAKHKDLIVSKLRGDDILGLVTSEVGLIMQITTKNMAADKIQPNAVENLADDYLENYYDSGVRCELR